jgi:hypothetical protein
MPRGRTELEARTRTANGRGEAHVKDRDEPAPIFPRHIRTYLTFNLVVAVLMAVVMVVRMELKSGNFLLIDYLLFSFYTLILAVIFFGPLGIVEIYLYRQKKGVWYAWKNRTRNRRLDRERNLDERRYWKNAAVLARLSRNDRPQAAPSNRTSLFPTETAGDSVSRAALLMRVADRFERSGKREAADRCYLEITERFANSPQAEEAARRLSSSHGLVQPN